MKTSFLLLSACTTILGFQASAQERATVGNWVSPDGSAPNYAGSLPSFMDTQGALPATTYTQSSLAKFGAPVPLEGLDREPQNLGTGARVDLLGLGARTTLTLINGRRAYGFADLGAIPIGAVDRVEILKGGSNPAYGSDGAAGVVNVITRGSPDAAPFRGVEIDLLYGFQASRGAKGGDFRSASIFAGTGNDKLSVTFGASYYNQSSLTLPERRLTTSFGTSVSGRPVLPSEDRRSVYGAFDYKVAGRAMEVYGDVLSNESRFGGRDGATVRSTRLSSGLRGSIPLSSSDVLRDVSYDFGVTNDQTRINRR